MTEEEIHDLVYGNKLHRLLYLKEFLYDDEIHCITNVSKKQNVVIMPKKSMKWTEIMGYVGNTKGLKLKELIEILKKKEDKEILKLLIQDFPDLLI